MTRALDMATFGQSASSGAIIQVVGKTLTTTAISTTAEFSDWVAIEGGSEATNFHVDISPKQTNSDFTITLTTSVGGATNAEGMILLRRGYDSSGGTSFSFTDIKGDSAGSSTQATYTSAYDYYDSGDVSTHTGHLITISSQIFDEDVSYVAGGKFRYKVYWRNPNNTAGDLYLNRPSSTSNAERATGISSIIVQEIAG